MIEIITNKAISEPMNGLAPVTIMRNQQMIVSMVQDIRVGDLLRIGRTWEHEDKGIDELLPVKAVRQL